MFYPFPWAWYHRHLPEGGSQWISYWFFFFFKENLVISSPGNSGPVVVFRFMQDCNSTPNLFRSTKREGPYREEESPVVSRKFLISSQEMSLAVPYSALCLARFRVYILEKLTWRHCPRAAKGLVRGGGRPPRRPAPWTPPWRTTIGRLDSFATRHPKVQSPGGTRSGEQPGWAAAESRWGSAFSGRGLPAPRGPPHVPARLRDLRTRRASACRRDGKPAPRRPSACLPEPERQRLNHRGAVDPRTQARRKRTSRKPRPPEVRHSSDRSLLGRIPASACLFTNLGTFRVWQLHSLQLLPSFCNYCRVRINSCFPEFPRLPKCCPGAGVKA